MRGRRSSAPRPSRSAAPGARFCTKTSARPSSAAEHRAVAGLLEVELDALLAAVQPDEVAGLAVHGPVVAAGEVAGAGPLDLDHARAEVGELAGGERRGHRLLQGDDGEAAAARARGHGATEFRADQLAGDHVALDLVGALADDHQRRVAEVALDVELGASSRSRRGCAPRPARSASRPPRRTAWPCRPPCRPAAPASYAPRRVQDELARGGQLGRHVGQVVADRLVLPDRLAEASPAPARTAARPRARPGRRRARARRPGCGRSPGRASSARSPAPSPLAEQRGGAGRGSRRRSARSSRRPCSRASAGRGTR